MEFQYLRRLCDPVHTFIEKMDDISPKHTPPEEKLKRLEELSRVALEMKQEIEHNFNAIHSTSDSAKKFDTSFEFFSNQIQSAVSTRCVDGSECLVAGRNLVSSILHMLGTKACGILLIETYIKLCTSTLKNIENDNSFLKSSGQYRSLLESLSSLSKSLKRYWHILFLNNEADVMMYLNQICKCIPLLLRSVNLKNTSLIKYWTQRLSQCFGKLSSELYNKCKHQEGSDFVHFLDKLLSILEHPFNGIATVEEMKDVLEETLCCGMSVAHISACPEDRKLIATVSDKILKEYENLKLEITENNVINGMNTQSVLTDALYILEQRVNRTVLRLYLNVFSDVHAPLKKMVRLCHTVEETVSKTSADLNALTELFDLNMDRVLQIGLFAISCSSDIKKTSGIRSCLASLESLEAELIPAITSLYLEGKDADKVRVQVLIDHWLKEVSDLAYYIDAVVDPAAFASVAEETIRDLATVVKHHLSQKGLVHHKTELLDEFLFHCRKFLKTIKVSFEDCDAESVPELLEHVSKLQRAVHECQGAVNLINSNCDFQNLERKITTRCELIVSTLQNLVPFLETLMNYTHNGDADLKEMEMTLFPDNLDSLPEDSPYSIDQELLKRRDYCKVTCVTPDNEFLEENVLTPYVNRGILLTQNRNIMYLTPKRGKATEQQKRVELSDDTLKRRRLFHEKKVSYFKEASMEDKTTDSLNITNVLDNLSILSDTFNTTICRPSAINDVITAASLDVKALFETEEQDIGKDVESDCKPSTSCSGCCAKMASTGEVDGINASSDSSNVMNSIGATMKSTFQHELFSSLEGLSLKSGSDQFDTLERETDLKKLDEKIKALKSNKF